jgi:hypothetical protein
MTILQTPRVSAIALLLSVVLSACSFRLELDLFDNAAAPLVVHLDGHDLMIKAENSGRFDYPGPNENWRLQISTEGCEYIYVVPVGTMEYVRPQGYHGALKAQLNPDMRIFLILSKLSALSMSTALAIFSVADSL